MVDISLMETGDNATADCTHANFLKQAQNTSLNKGDTWYVISSKWLEAYDSFVEKKGENPGPIDNSDILATDSDGNESLSENVVEESDFDTVPEYAWIVLKEKFGVKHKSHEMARKVIESGVIKQTLRLELYPLNVTVRLAQGDCAGVRLEFSRAQTLTEFVDKSKEALKIENEEFLMYLQHSEQLELLENKAGPNAILENYLSPNQVIIFDVKDRDGNFSVNQNEQITNGTSTDQASTSDRRTVQINMPSILSKTQSMLSSSDSLRSGNVYGNEDEPMATSSSVKQYVPGACGLQNLGNTCFMNSGLQCLSSIPQLTKYFVESRQEGEVNETNPLGTGGKLARAYAGLMHTMWSGTQHSTVPRQFKNIIGDYCPTFSGYSQQDSQELMLSTLDLLHEDLNRIKNKPYVELKEAEGRTDQVVAVEAWDNHLKRNDSIITDLIHGLLKSTLVCPDCDRISTKFDPFCFLSVPVPSRAGKIFSFYLVPDAAESKWIKMKVRVSSTAKVDELFDEVKKLKPGLDNFQLLLCETTHGRLTRFFRPDDYVSYTEKDYILYVLPKIDNAVTIVCMQRYEKSLGGFESSTFSSRTWNVFSWPIVIRLPIDKINMDTIRNEVTDKLHPTFCTWPDDERWWESGSEDEQAMDTDEDSPVPAPPTVFNLTVCNTFGANTDDAKGKDRKTSSLVDSIKKDDSSRPGLFGDSLLYLGVDWNPIAKQKLYLHNYAEEVEEDESVNMQNVTVTLDDCLELFSKEEQLGKGNEWYCPTCKEGKQASKKMEIWSLPKILIVQLKRFNQARMWRSKIDHFIDFPLEDLNMAQWVINDQHPSAVYDLIAISNHMGGLGGGHYTADAYNFVDKSWYHFDDSHSSKENTQHAKSKYAYVLVYMLREPKQLMDNNIEKEDT